MSDQSNQVGGSMSLALLTQYSFLATFIAFCAATFFFVLERDSLPVEYRSTASISACYLGIAAVNYFLMLAYAPANGSFDSLVKFPTELRYIDWLLTTPLMLIKFPSLLGAASNRMLLILLIVADVIMIVTGYAAEVIFRRGGSGNEVWAFFLVGCLAFLFILYLLYAVVTAAQEDALGPISDGLDNMKKFILIGWSIYPILFIVIMISNTAEVKVVRELLFNVADAFNKIGLAVIAVSAARAVARDREIKEAMSRL
jgi:sensory rhodopsin